MLKDMCDSLVQNIICIFIQENWLTNENLHKLNIFNGYTFYGCSAMNEVVYKSVLQGRPFGGVGILIKSNLCSGITHHMCAERFSIIVCLDVLFISVYLPCVDHNTLWTTLCNLGIAEHLIVLMRIREDTKLFIIFVITFSNHTCAVVEDPALQFMIVMSNICLFWFLLNFGLEVILFYSRVN